MPHGTAPGSRILIVDDQEMNVLLLEDVLEQAGYDHVRSITDPRQAVAVFREFAPDLVLLDLLMPGLDGYEVMARLRPLVPEGGFLPILVLTADASVEARRRALAEGATDFLSKPIDTTETLLRIRNLLHTRSLHRQFQAQNEALEERVRERTRELEEARAQVLELYRDMSRRYQQLQELVDRVMQPMDGRRAGPQAPGAQSSEPPVEALTPREREVLALLARGQTNSEIAAQLVVGVATVKSHVENIIAKLGVSDRTQAAVRALELGLLSIGG